MSHSKVISEYAREYKREWQYIRGINKKCEEFITTLYFGGDLFNRPFPSSKKPHFQNEAKCETFVVKINFICIIIENHFHINGFALSLALKVRFFGTRKWPILLKPIILSVI